jgi:hypothetical protein
MTLQIGMLGQDGVILAGDSRINAKPIPGADAPWMSYEGQKIHISKSGRIAVSCPHDLQSGSHVASELGVGLATLHRASVPRSKTRERDFGTP